MPESFRQRFLSGERLFGTMLTLPSGAVAEILSDAGFDWLFVNAEHGPSRERRLILERPMRTESSPPHSMPIVRQIGNSRVTAASAPCRRAATAHSMVLRSRLPWRDIDA